MEEGEKTLRMDESRKTRRERKKDRDYDNAEVIAVQLW